MLVKLGELSELSVNAVSEGTFAASQYLNEPGFEEQFNKIASELKILAPKAKDFLYFVATMMHAAERSLLDDNGNIRKDASGKEITVSWEEKNDSLKWICSDPSIKAYKNNNGDIFREAQLVRYHKDWVGKPLCVDHKSDSVDHIRGVIIDTYYDFAKKRVIALCALDKVNYPDLARKISTGTSTCVSMGTAVGRAICTDCGTVARVEADFCDHMRYKTCYGEINEDLKPIELSIVVNGADQLAKIKHVMAATNSLANYVSMKKDLLDKKADLHEMVKPDEIKEIMQDLDKVKERLDKLQESAERVKTIEKDEETGEHPEEKQASADVEMKKLGNALNGIQKDLKDLKNVVSNLKNSEDKQMADKKAYHLGGGGVNDPASLPYPKEDSDSIRDKQDKQMVGAPPFPNTGDVNSLYPGDEAKKKEYLRAAEERALRRKDALEKAKASLEKKKAYHLGGGGPNDPKALPYPKEDSDSIRDKEDKQMVGAPPFPGVGNVDGLYGDDLKKKEMVLRAKLTGKFVKAADAKTGKDDRGNCRWQVYAGDKLILTATVNELSNGKSDLLYDVIATEDFGKHILKVMKANDFETAKSLLCKKAQEAMPPMETPAAPAEQMAPTADLGALDKPMDAGGKGDPKDELPALLDAAENALVDVRHGVDALLEESGSKLEGFDELEKIQASEEVTKLLELGKVQKKVSKDVLVGMQKLASELEDQVKELGMIQTLTQNSEHVSPAEMATVAEFAKEVVAATKTTLTNTKLMYKSFIDYADGTRNLVTRAKEQLDSLKKTADHAHKVPNLPGVAQPRLPNETEIEYLKRMRGDRSGLEKTLQDVTTHPTGWHPESQVSHPGTMTPEAIADVNKADMNDAKMTMKDGTTVELTGDELKKVHTASEKGPDLSTKEGRAAYRAKLAEQALEYSSKLKEAHPGGGATPSGVSAGGDLAKVEDLPEVKKKMMEVLHKTPAVVRAAGDEINQLVVEGKIDPKKDFDGPDGLVARGLDPAAVKYWKEYWGETAAKSDFATKVVEEYREVKAAEVQKTYEVKLARAYDVAYEMVRKGMIENSKEVLAEEVKRIMEFNDSGFESYKRWVEKQMPEKRASMPQVGLADSAFVSSNFPMRKEASSDLKAQLDQLWEGAYKRRNF